jgi:hypothetical protein
MKVMLQVALGAALLVGLVGCPRPALPDANDNGDATNPDVGGSVADKALSFQGRAIGTVESLSSTSGLPAVEAGRKTAQFLATGATGSKTWTATGSSTATVTPTPTSSSPPTGRSTSTVCPSAWTSAC